MVLEGHGVPPLGSVGLAEVLGLADVTSFSLSVSYLPPAVILPGVVCACVCVLSSPRVLRTTFQQCVWENLINRKASKRRCSLGLLISGV